MKEAVAFYQKNWWVYLVEGVITLLFGIVAVFAPAEVVAVLGFYLGLFLIIAGLADVVLGIAGAGKRELWWATLLLGIVQTGIGVYLFRRPGLSLAVFIVYIALALLVRGIIALVEAFNKSLDSGTKALYAISGVMGLLASLIVWRYPVKGTMAFVWVLGLYALISGPIVIAFAFKAKKGLSD